MAQETLTTHLIYGATSLLGSYFLYSRAEQPERFIIFSPGSTASETRECLQHRLESCAASYRRQFRAEDWKERINVVSQENSAALLPHTSVDYFWYFAVANVDLIDNTQRALELARSIAAKRFLFFSSAFAAGRQAGLIPEQLHSLPREFHDAEEEIMCRAEHAVAAFCETNSLDYRILRPSIVIGPSLTMTTGDCQTVLDELIKKLSEPADGNHQFSQTSYAEVPVNLITIDQLLADISYLLENDFAGGPFYHLTSTRNLTLAEVFSTIRGIVAPAAEQPVPLDIFGPLMGGHLFARSLPREDGVTKDELYGYVVESARKLRGDARIDWEQKWLPSPDGFSFSSYVGGRKDSAAAAVVLINALGMPVLLLAPLARRLAPHFKIATWESRWAPSPDGDFDPQRCDLHHHLTDLTTLLDYAEIDRAHLLGWCNGAQLALKFASLFPQRARSLVLLNGTFNLPETITRTAFEKNMRMLMPKIAANKSFAELYYRMATDARFKSNDAQAQAASFMACRNPALRHLTNAPFKTPELLYRYANMVTRTFAEPPPATNLSLPVLIVTGNEDQVSHPDTSREIARQINNSSLTIVAGGDHHALHDDQRVQNMVLDFLIDSRR